MSATLLLSALCLMSAPAEGRLEILALDAKPRDITAISVSPNGKYQMANVGQTLEIARFNGDDISRIQLPVVGSLTTPMFINNSGEVIAEYRAGPNTNVIATRAVIYRRDGLETIPTPEPNLDRNASFKVMGLSHDGSVLGGTRTRYAASAEGPLNSASAVIWKDGSMRPVAEFPGFLGIVYAVAETTQGVVGIVPRFITAGHASLGLPVIFHSNKSFTRLPLPTGSNSGRPMAATPDASVIVGSASADIGGSVAVLWRDGIVAKPENYKRGLPTGVLSDVTDDGKLAVGTSYAFRGGGAIVWDEALGAMSLADYAAAKKIELPAEWALTNAVGVSPDGSFVFGTATSKKLRRPYRLWLKEPKKD
jgi:hypothetical protein